MSTKRRRIPTQQKALSPVSRRRAVRLPPVEVRLPAPDVSVVQEVWNVLRRRWPIIAATVVVLVGATALYCMMATPLYRAQAMVLIDGRAPQILANQATPDNAAFTSTKYDYFQTQFTLLRSTNLTKRVIDELGLVSDPRFVEEPSPKGSPIESWHVGAYLENLTVMPVRNTRLVGVQYLSPDPDLAADVANAHARLFVRSGLEGLYAAMEQIRGFLQMKLAELQPRMQEAERKLLDFQAEHKLMPVHLSKDVASERLMDLARRLTAAEAERIAQEAQYQLVKKRDYDSLPAVMGNGLIQKLRGDVNHLEVEYALLAAKFTPSYPQMKQLGGQLERARQVVQVETAKVIEGVETAYLAAQNTAEQLKAELETQRQALLGRKDIEGELLTLVREAETTRALYDNILGRVKELDVTGGSDASNISVTELAVAPTWPASPATRLNLVISFMTALLLGSGLAFLRDSWDRTVRDPQSIRTATGLPTLAVVPDFDQPPHASLNDAVRWQAGRARQLARSGWKRAGGLAPAANGNGKTVEPDGPVASPRLLLGDGHEPPSAEAYRTLRTSLLLSREGGAPRVIVLTSAAGTEGKTTTAVNTAAALASSGAPVLLIDGDLRLPRCHDALRLPLEPGLSEYLAGDVAAEPIQATGVPNLSFLAAGRMGANPTQLLTSWRLGMLLWQARKTFDFIVIDSPPLLAVSDALLIANLADGAVLVAERGKTTLDSVKLAVQRLQQAGVMTLGAVLNRGEIEFEYYRYTRPTVRARAVPVTAPVEGEEQYS